MSKIPIVNFTSGTKRRIDMPLDNVSNNNEGSMNLSRPEAKRLNMSTESNDGENSGEPAKRMQPNKFGSIHFLIICLEILNMGLTSSNFFTYRKQSIRN